MAENLEWLDKESSEQDLFRRFLENKYRKNTVEKYMGFYIKLGGVENLTQDFVSAFLQKYNSQLARAMIKQLIDYAIKNPFRYNKELLNRVRLIIIPDTKKQNKGKIPDTIDEDSLKMVIRRINNPRDKLICLWGFYCGLRISEILNIKVDDFNWDVWRKNPENFGQLIVKEEGVKGGKERRALVQPFLMEKTEGYIRLIAQQKKQSRFDPIFKITRQAFSRILSKASIDTIGRRIHPHTLRHGFAIHLKKKGMALEKIQHLMGHSDIKTTQIYARMSDQDLEEDWIRIMMSKND